MDKFECKSVDLQDNIVSDKDKDYLISLYEASVDSDNVGNLEKSSDLEQEIKDFLTEKNCIKQGIILNSNDKDLWMFKFDMLKSQCERIYSIKKWDLDMLNDTDKVRLVQVWDLSAINGSNTSFEDELKRLGLLLASPVYFDNYNIGTITKNQLSIIAEIIYPYSIYYEPHYDRDVGQNMVETELMNMFSDGDMINGMELQDAFAMIFDKYTDKVFEPELDKKREFEIMKLCYDMRIVDSTSYNNYLSFVEEEFKHYV